MSMKIVDFLTENDRSVTPREILNKEIENDGEKRRKHK
jgi:hypothetical protein